MLKKWCIIVLMLQSIFSDAQTDFPYQSPDQNIYQLADAKPAPGVRLNSDASQAVLTYRNNFKSIEEMSAPELKLAGVRINPAINGPSRVGYVNGLQILDVKTTKVTNVTGLPSSPSISNMTWSNNQKLMAFTHSAANGMEIWILDMATAEARRLTGPVVNGVISNVIVWTKDDKSILFPQLLANRKPIIDTKIQAPKGPTISENDGQKAQNRTYQDLLRNAYDEENFETLATSEIASVDMKGKISVFKGPAMHAGISVSPDGNYYLVYELKRPFSYLVTYGSFPMDIQILDKAGKFVKTFYKVPLIEDLPKGFMAVRKGPRSIQWRSDKPATLVWAEAQDGGDPSIEVPYRDHIMAQDAPFNAVPSLMTKSKLRFAGIAWGDEKRAIMYERWWNTRTERTLMIDPSSPNAEPRLFNERNYQDEYADLGDPVMKMSPFRTSVLDLTGDRFILMGDGFSKEGKFPFIDEYKVADFSKNRLYQAKDQEKLESLVNAIDASKGTYITRLESKSDYPNLYIRDIKSNSVKALTNNENPFKVLENVHKEVIKYKRPDGVELSATLYLPVGYTNDTKEKLPMVMWAYPTEFKDKNSASQVTSNAQEFTFPNYGSPLYWLTKGYIVLDDASFPIIGEGDNEPNDTFIPQLVANAKAAIDAVDERGYLDRTKVAVGGHSYGAFMVANLLTHSNLFAAGIARSGAYNRTLTPFGFQSEERNYWEAPEVYDAMSPFQHADKMKTPMLLIHGEEDNNPGTFPIQSERYFNALKGLGATARLVVLPKESHGYAAKESIMHMLWEQDQWMEKYVKRTQKSEKP